MSSIRVVVAPGCTLPLSYDVSRKLGSFTHGYEMWSDGWKVMPPFTDKDHYGFCYSSLEEVCFWLPDCRAVWALPEWKALSGNAEKPTPPLIEAPPDEKVMSSFHAKFWNGSGQEFRLRTMVRHIGNHRRRISPVRIPLDKFERANLQRMLELRCRFESEERVSRTDLQHFSSDVDDLLRSLSYFKLLGRSGNYRSESEFHRRCRDRDFSPYRMK